MLCEHARVNWQPRTGCTSPPPHCCTPCTTRRSAYHRLQPSPALELNTFLKITCKRHAHMRAGWCRRAKLPLQALSDGPIAPIVRQNDSRARKARAPRRRIEAVAEGGGGGASGSGAPSFLPIDISQPGRHLLKVARPPKDVASTEAFGPRGLLLVGLSQSNCDAVRSWMQAMEAGFAVSPCPAALLEEGTLRAALLGSAAVAGDSGGGGGGEAALDGSRAVAEHAWEQPPAWSPPLVFFSGMEGREVLAVIEHWGECTGLAAPAFASVTPGTLDKPLKRLVEEIVRAQPAARGAAAAGAAAPGVAAAAGGKVKEFTLLGADGEAVTSAMGGEELREALRARVEAKRREKARAERRAAARDDTDRLREALRGGKKGGGKGGASGGQQQQQSRGFG